jgi:hypothetical protein
MTSTKAKIFYQPPISKRLKSFISPLLTIESSKINYLLTKRISALLSSKILCLIKKNDEVLRISDSTRFGTSCVPTGRLSSKETEDT